jgi:ribosomal protein L35
MDFTSFLKRFKPGSGLFDERDKPFKSHYFYHKSDDQTTGHRMFFPRSGL